MDPGRRQLRWQLPRLSPPLRLLLLLPAACALPAEVARAPAPRQLKGVPMDGACSVVSHHDNWEDEATGMVS